MTHSKSGKIIHFLLLALISSTVFEHCAGTSKPVTKSELIKFIAEQQNNLIKKLEVNGFAIEIAYQPSSLMIARELNKTNFMDSVVRKSLEEKYNHQLFFLIRFSKNGKEAIRQLGSFSSYSTMVSTFSFEMGNYVNLTTIGKDTVELSNFFFDQTYGFSDANTILLSFEREKLKRAKMFSINLAECGLGTGQLKFEFDSPAIDKVPLLDYNTLY